jgi:glycerate kinase
MGKAPGYVIDLAESLGKKVHVLAGNVDPQIMRARNIKYVSLTEIASSSELAISDPEKWLESATIELTKILDL